MPDKVLIVDDQKSIRQHIIKSLRGADYVFIEAEDGADGIEKLTENPDTCLILSDVNMPNMNGISMLKAIRLISKHDHIPVLMLTAEISTEFVSIAKTIGAVGLIVKPFKPEMLSSAIRKIVDMRRNHSAA